MSESTANSENPDETPEAEQPEEFLNRAARRAKGKAKGPHQHTEHAHGGPHGRGAVPGSRQYSNRRSG
ncbi:hypothetical protein ACQP2X_10915 [Actinoplanes sp. CA-131856]